MSKLVSLGDGDTSLSGGVDLVQLAFLFTEYLATNDDEKGDGKKIDDEDDRGNCSHVFWHRACDTALRKRNKKGAGKVDCANADAIGYLRVHVEQFCAFYNGDDHGDGHNSAARFAKQPERPNAVVRKEERQNE